MPHSNRWENEGVYRKFTGVIDRYEILESNFGMHVQPEFRKIRYVINDFTEISGFNIDKSDTDVYASTDNQIARTKGDLRVALVVSGQEQTALAEGYCAQMRDSPFECGIFQTVEAAREWAASTDD